MAMEELRTMCGATLESGSDNWLESLYIMASMSFVMALRGLSKQETATWGCIYGCCGMTLAIAGAIASDWVCDHGYWLAASAVAVGAIIGSAIAYHFGKDMLKMPVMVGMFNAFGGLASSLEAMGLFASVASKYGPSGSSESRYTKEVIVQSVALHLSLIVGSITFFGSIVACGKLGGQISSKARAPKRKTCISMFLLLAAAAASTGADFCGYGDEGGFVLLMVSFFASALWGILFAYAIGGADMPVVICILNTGSGIAGVFAGFMLANKLLVITGTFVASSGVILTVIMCIAMNKSLLSVIFPRQGDPAGPAGIVEGEVQTIDAKDVTELLAKAKSVLMVPGYGMAAAGAQHPVADVTSRLRAMGISVLFGIHPVAGRLPGHMNVLLAEAKVPYDIVKEMTEVNPGMEQFDVALILGANDIVNPAATEEPNCPIAGMPVIEVWRAKRVIIIKRSLGAGYSGVDNPLFVRENSRMFLGSAKPLMKEIGELLGQRAQPAQAMAQHDDLKLASIVSSMDMHSLANSIEATLPCDNPECTIGVIRELDPMEARVALTPSVCAKLVAARYAVIIENGAGNGSGIPDAEYRRAGCTLDDREEVVRKSSVLLAVQPPMEIMSPPPTRSVLGSMLPANPLHASGSKGACFCGGAKLRQGLFDRSNSSNGSNGSNHGPSNGTHGVGLVEKASDPASEPDVDKDSPKAPQTKTVSISSFANKLVVAWVGYRLKGGKEVHSTASAASINLLDVTAVPRVTIAQKLDVLSSQAKCAGHRAVLEAAHEYQRFFAPEITAAGKYAPCQVMVLGAGVAGLAAISTAVALGSSVRAWDVRDIHDQIESLGASWITVDFKEEGAGTGGYAKESSQEFQKAQKETFHRHAKACDIIILTAAIPGRPSPRLMEDYMVADMRPGSVIVDLAAMGGGNCALTRKDEKYVFQGQVTIIGYTDMASRMGMQASEMYATNMYNLLDHICGVVKTNGGSKSASALLPNLEHVMEEKVFLGGNKPEQQSMEELCICQSMISYKGQKLMPPPPPQPSSVMPKEKQEQVHVSKSIQKQQVFGGGVLLSSQFLLISLFALLIGVAFLDYPVLTQMLMVFMLSAWVGFMLVWNVQPALHTPLMSVSNAISGQVVLGGIFMVSSENIFTTILGAAAVVVASMNVFGGFMVTYKMLAMFRK